MAKLMREEFASMVLLTMAPTPPDVPRVFPSESAISSKTAVQLKNALIVASLLARTHRGSWIGAVAGKYRVTLSVKPSIWQAAHEPQPSPLSDQRPRPVLKKRCL
ncbi:MAG: hypothetical protein IPK83_24545 [Planctomycetes bacterium]|nr:hypothetical protein [Planctomycetota bacterium]